MSSPSPSFQQPSQTRAIVLLAVAGFASQAMVRSADSILPQIAHDLSVTIGAASIAVWAYSLVHGSMQLVIGPLGDRFGKYRSAAVASPVPPFVGPCGVIPSLPLLTVARIASAAFAAWMISMGMAYIGDVVLYANREHVLRAIWARSPGNCSAKRRAACSATGLVGAPRSSSSPGSLRLPLSRWRGACQQPVDAAAGPQRHAPELSA